MNYGFYLLYGKFQTLSGKLSWLHYLLLLGVSDEHARSFYEHECENSNWGVREWSAKIINRIESKRRWINI